MSAYTNGLALWKHFEEKQGAIINCLKAEQYEELNELIQELDEEVMEISGAHFFVESFYDSFEMTFDTGPNKTTQYLCQMLCDIAPKSVKQKWIMNATLPPMSQKAIQAMVQIKNEEYTLADFHVFYQIENDMLDCKVYCPGFNLIGNPENKKEMSMYLMELAIGQLAYEAYICRVDFIDTPDSDMKFCQMIDFYEVIMALVEKNHWKVYDKPIDIYSVYQPIQDFAHDALRKDMKLIFTTHPYWWNKRLRKRKKCLQIYRVKMVSLAMCIIRILSIIKKMLCIVRNYRNNWMKLFLRCMQVKWLGELLVRAFPILTGLCMIKTYL